MVIPLSVIGIFIFPANTRADFLASSLSSIVKLDTNFDILTERVPRRERAGAPDARCQRDNGRGVGRGRKFEGNTSMTVPNTTTSGMAWVVDIVV